MSRIIQCPSCEKTLKLGEASAQKSIIDCPVCAQKIRINNDSPAASAEKPATSSVRQAAAEPSRSHSNPESRTRRTERSSRDRQSESPSRRSSQSSRSSAPSRRSKKAETVRTSRARGRSVSNNSTLSIAMMTAGITLSFMGAMGAIWWVAGNLGTGSENSNQQLVAQTDTDVSDPDLQLESARTNPDHQPSTSPSTQSAVNVPQSIPPVEVPPEQSPPGNVPASVNSVEPNLVTENSPANNLPPDMAEPSFTPSTSVPSNLTQPGTTTPAATQPEATQPATTSPAITETPTPTTPPPTTTPPPVTERSSVASVPDDLLHYGLHNGDTHVYSFEVAAEIEGRTLSFPGSVSLSVSSGRAAGLEDTIHGTGTGFVVTESGYLVTCHHVIEDAMVIEVVLNGQTYPAQVVASNKKQDLAIVKVEASGLPFVSLADSDKALLAEDVRAIGYPLTDLLGQGLKVTRGTISGINEDPDRRRFQVDAAINPGNSGGPLFNERGQVIGVNSAKLYADDTVSTVGFAVPSNYTKQLLQQNRITFDEKDGGPALTGPVLVQNVRTAVALLKVEKRKHINEQFVLNYTGHFNNPLGKSGVPFPGARNESGFTSEISSSGKVIVDEFGEIEDVEDANQLPFYVGNMATLMIHPLDPDGERTWTREIPFLLVKARQSGSSFNGPGSQFGGRFGGRRDEIPDEILTGGIETHQYRIIETNDREIKVSRTYELRTLDHPTRPLASITGKGTITFDRRDMMPSSMNFRQTYEIRKDGTTITIPMTIGYLRQNGTSHGSGFASRVQAAAAARAKSRKERIRQAALEAAEKLAQKEEERKAKAARVGTMSEDQRLSFYLDEIRSKRGYQVYSSLARMDVIESRRAEVCSLLESCLTSRRFDQEELMALAHWATPEAISAMIQKLETIEPRNWTATTRLVAALASTKSKQAIAPIMKVLASNQNALNDAARRALGVLGPMAEDSLIAEMQASATSVGVKTLGDIGSEKSIPVLEEIAKASGPWLRRYSNDAIARIKRRLM